MNWKGVLRDSLIVLGLTLAGGFVIGLSAPSDPLSRALAIAASNIIFMTIGFTISGAIVKVGRFKHLFKVAIVSWLICIFNVLLGFSFFQWLFGLVYALIAMCIGGGLSFLFAKSPKSSETKLI
jgi:hypothetical protein